MVLQCADVYGHQWLHGWQQARPHPIAEGRLLLVSQAWMDWKGWICGVDDWIMMDYVEGLVINDQGQSGLSGIDFLQPPQFSAVTL